MPTARSMPREAAFSRPSVTSRLRGLMSGAIVQVCAARARQYLRVIPQRGMAYDGGMTRTSEPHGYTQEKENYAKRLRRIEGQVRGIARMIDEDKYCIDVLTQISAAHNA